MRDEKNRPKSDKAERGASDKDCLPQLVRRGEKVIVLISARSTSIPALASTVLFTLQHLNRCSDSFSLTRSHLVKRVVDFNFNILCLFLFILFCFSAFSYSYSLDSLLCIFPILLPLVSFTFTISFSLFSSAFSNPIHSLLLFFVLTSLPPLSFFIFTLVSLLLFRLI